MLVVCLFQKGLADTLNAGQRQQRQQQHLRALMRVDRTEPLVARMRTAAITAPFINVRIGKTTFLDALQKIFGATGFS